MNVKTEETHVTKGCQVKRDDKYKQIVTLGQSGCPCGAHFDFPCYTLCESVRVSRYNRTVDYV